MKLLKFMFRWAFRLALVLVAALVLLLLFKDALLRVVVERQIRAQTGMEARLGKFETSFTTPVVNLENLRLYNTPEFGGSPFLTIAELHLEYDLDALRRGKLGFKLVRFNLSELNIVRNEAGKVNIQTRPPSASSGGAGGGKGKGGEKMFEFGGIGTLNLTLGRVRYTDIKKPANSREASLGVRDEVFKNIRHEGDLYGVLFVLLARHGVDLGGVGGVVPLKL